MDRIRYPDDDFNSKLYESLFGGKLNRDIFKKKRLTESDRLNEYTPGKSAAIEDNIDDARERSEAERRGVDKVKPSMSKAVEDNIDDARERSEAERHGFDKLRNTHIEHGSLEDREPIGDRNKTISKIEVVYTSLMDYNTFSKLEGNKVLACGEPWWLKAKGDDGGVFYIDEKGYLKEAPPYKKLGFRPMIEVIPEDFEDVNLYQPCEALNNKWIKITNKYLLAAKPFGNVPFDQSQNDYEKSKIKTFLDEWANSYFSHFDNVAFGDEEVSKTRKADLNKDDGK